MEEDVPVATVTNLFIGHEKLDGRLVYSILKTLMENQPALVHVHREARNFTMERAVLGSSLPFHSGALQYYQERELP